MGDIHASCFRYQDFHVEYRDSAKISGSSTEGHCIQRSETLITGYNSASYLCHTILDVGVYAQPIFSIAKLCRSSSPNHAAVLVKCSYTVCAQ